MDENNTVDIELRDLLFPNGKPEPDEFVMVLTELAKQIRETLQNDK
jgi:hypothetical protein